MNTSFHVSSNEGLVATSGEFDRIENLPNPPETNKATFGSKGRLGLWASAA